MNRLFSLFETDKRTNEFFFTLTIDYRDQLKRDGHSLGDQEFIYEPNYKLELPVKELEFRLIEYLEKYLGEEIFETFGFEVKIKVKRTRRGSIVIVFSVILAKHYSDKKYKKFIDSIPLIKKHTEWLMQSFLDTQFSRLFKVVASTHSVVKNEDATSKNSNYTLLFGILLGAFLVGLFTYLTQRMSNKQQLELYNQQQTISERQELKNTMIEYSDLIANYTSLISDNQLDSNTVNDFDKHAFRIAFKLSLLSKSNLSNKTFQLNKLATYQLKKKLEGNYTETNSREFADSVFSWTKEAKIELNNEENPNLSSNFKNDIIKLLK